MKKHFHTAVSRAHHVIRTLRNRRILTRRTILTALASLNVLFLGVILLHTISYPNTIVGNRNVGLQSSLTIRPFLASNYRTPFKLIINSRVYDVTYEQLGIYLDTDQTIRNIFASNVAPFPINITKFFTQLFFPRTIPLHLAFSQEFYDFVAKTNDAGQHASDIVYINQENKTVTLFQPEQRYDVNTKRLQERLQEHFGSSDETITAPLSEIPSPFAQDVETTNTKLQSVYVAPLTIIVGIGDKNRFITFSPDDLKRYTIASISALPASITFTINNDVFKKDLVTALSFYNIPTNIHAAYERIGNGIKSALLTRSVGTLIDSVKVSIDDGPNTDGSIADTYIEVDISQQKMFTFLHGAVYKTYRVSTGKDYPTPIGKFAILNKSDLGYSSIYNVWMPYWMGFAYSDQLNAYFGIHELPYSLSEGTKIQRPRDFIGAPNTGGCVALDIGDAKEVYKFADVGTPVVIYE